MEVESSVGMRVRGRVRLRVIESSMSGSKSERDWSE